jgi:hypothetical protein
MNKAKTQAKTATNGKISANRNPKLTTMQKNALKYEELRKKQNEDYKKWKESNTRMQEEEEKRAIISAELYEQNKEMIKQKEDKQRREKWEKNPILKDFIKKHLIICTFIPLDNYNDEQYMIYRQLNNEIDKNNTHFRVLDRMQGDDKKYKNAINDYNFIMWKIKHFKKYNDDFIFNKYNNDYVNNLTTYNV